MDTSIACVEQTVWLICNGLRLSVMEPDWGLDWQILCDFDYNSLARLKLHFLEFP